MKIRLNAENYYSADADRAYFSFSQVKRFLWCEAAAMDALLNPVAPEKTTALLVGSFVDAHFSGAGELDRFKAENPGIFNSRTGELKSDFQQAQRMIERIEADGLMKRMLIGNKQSIVTGKIDGYPFMGKLDVLQTAVTARKTAQLFPDMSELAFAGGAIVDLKTTKDFKPVYDESAGGKVSFIQFRSYDLQLAIYQELVHQKTGKRMPCYIVAVTKEPEPDIGVFNVTQRDMDNQLAFLRDRLQHIAEVKTGKVKPSSCGKCAFCRSKKVLTGAIPSEALRPSD